MKTTPGIRFAAVCVSALVVLAPRTAARATGLASPAAAGHVAGSGLQPGTDDTQGPKAESRSARTFARSVPPPIGQPAPDPIAQLLQRLEQAVRAGDVATYEQMVIPAPDEPGGKFLQSVIRSGATRAVLRERARLPLAPGGLRVAVDVFCEFGQRAQISTWTLDFVPRQAGTVPPSPDGWLIKAPQSMSPLTTLYTLALAPKQYVAKDLVITAEDLELRLPEGAVFAAETEQGPTALVLVGRGHMLFRPTPPVEREQMRFFAHAEAIDTPFTTAYIRIAPEALREHIGRGSMKEGPVDAGVTKTAEETFKNDSAKSFGVNLGDLAPGQWSLMPGMDDFLAEVHTQRFGALTYARSARAAEDVSLFERSTRRNISLYTSREKLTRRGRFYDDDDGQDYDVIHYDIDASIDPLRQSLTSVARVTLQVKVTSVTMLTLRLAESLSVDSVVSREFGRLFPMRVVNQNSFIIGLPKSVPQGTVLGMTVSYHGRIAPQMIDREAITIEPPQERSIEVGDGIALEPAYLYSNRNYWYPQGETSTHATATLRIKVPNGYMCVASGDPEPPPGSRQGPRTPLASPQFLFRALQPVRYLSLLITRMQPVGSKMVAGGVDGDGEVAALQKEGVFYSSIQLDAFASPLMRGRANSLSDRATDILRFYSSLVGDCPYPTMALAVIERELPGGHSPAYLAVLNQSPPATPYTWRNDPVAFDNYPSFFIAHEIAHQWWGQAVGWKNYHEQWLSEGLSQYFAALYAERLHGKPVFDSIIRRMQEWGMKRSDEGPVYLGYRIGHVKRDSQLFRAVVYNKSAAVLHMLRRLIGDEAFLHGLRRFYHDWRFRRAGSDDLQRAFEAESGRSLARFFERWIYDSRLPRLRFSWGTTRNAASGEEEAVLRFEQVGEVFDVPVTATLEYADGPAVDVVVPVCEALSEMRVPIHGRLRRISVNRDHAALARIEK